MKTWLGRVIGLGFIFILAAATTTQNAEATVIDFNNIPDGTPVSEGNPYAGILVIESRAGWIGPPDWPPVWTSVDAEWVEIWLPTLVGAGRVDTYLGDRQPPLPPGPEFHGWRFIMQSYLTATFLEPVTDVSFQGLAAGVFYAYQGVNGAGDVYTRNGLIDRGPPGFGGAKYELTLPDGYYLTQFYMGSHSSGSGYDFSIDDIAFTRVGVPDSGSSAVLLGLGFVGVLSISHLRRPVKV